MDRRGGPRDHGPSAGRTKERGGGGRGEKGVTSRRDASKCESRDLQVLSKLDVTSASVVDSRPTPRVATLLELRELLRVIVP